MRTVLSILLILLTQLQASDCKYQYDYLKPGEPYLKINVDDSTLWIGIKCGEDSLRYKEILRILGENELLYVNMVQDYRVYGASLNKQITLLEQKKCSYGVYGFIVGFITSAFIITLINTCVL